MKEEDFINRSGKSVCVVNEITNATKEHCIVTEEGLRII